MKSVSTKTVTIVVAASLGVLTAAGCGSSGDTQAGGGGITLTVLAASSLTEPFSSLERRFEATHPGVDAVFSFDSSSTLAAQVTQGAPADVLATADQATMNVVTDAGDTAGDPVTFARNTLVIVTPPGNPARVTGVRDLADPAVKVAICDESAPCGSAAASLLALDRVNVTPVSLEPDVKSVLTKVTLGEVDAGIVYASDAVTAGRAVSVVGIDNAGQVVNEYPIAVLAASRQPRVARAWVQLVLSPRGRKVLTRDGFTVP